jgi:hypothetical protein
VYVYPAGPGVAVSWVVTFVQVIVFDEAAVGTGNGLIVTEVVATPVQDPTEAITV